MNEWLELLRLLGAPILFFVLGLVVGSLSPRRRRW